MSESQDFGEMVQVHLLELPVQLAAKSQEHFQELLREFVLISSDSNGSADHVPARLLQLVEVLTQQYGGINTAAEERLEQAIASGATVIDDHVLDVPAGAGPAAQALGDMIDEADRYCREGQHLLTLATPADCVAYRRWYLSQCVEQVDGGAPVSWPEFARTAPELGAQPG